MLEQIAQELATSISKAIECEVAIFDRGSIIVGSSDLARLGLFNEGSVKVIRTGKPLVHRPGYIEHMQNTKPGHCFPLFLFGEVIGAVGIAGAKDEVKKYAQLVQSLAEIVMREAMNQMTRISTNYAHHDLIQNIVNMEPSQASVDILLRKGFEIGVDLRYAHIPVALDLLNLPATPAMQELSNSQEVLLQTANGRILRLVDQIFSDVNDICAFTAHDKILILHSFANTKEEKEVTEAVRKKCDQLQELMHQEGIDIICGIGTVSAQLIKLPHSCKTAWLVLNIASKLKKASSIQLPDRWTFCMKDYFIEAAMSDSRSKCMDWYEEKHLALFFVQPNVDELIKTIVCWCESGFKYTKAAEMLFIHRNTLMYRLKKIETLCGVSIEEPREVIALYLAILRSVLVSGQH